MTHPNQRGGQSEPSAAASPPPRPKPAAISYIRKLQAVEHLTTDILSRIEKLLQQDAAAIVGKQSAMLPREIEDSQAYFLEKTSHVRTTLREISTLLPGASETLDLRELVGAELLTLFVLIESYRPERITESGWNLGEETQEALRERIDVLSLDLINMRQRLK